MEKTIYTRCKRCNRPLKTKDAREKGYGPHCWHLHKIEYERNKSTLISCAEYLNNHQQGVL